MCLLVLLSSFLCFELTSQNTYTASPAMQRSKVFQSSRHSEWSQTASSPYSTVFVMISCIEDRQLDRHRIVAPVLPQGDFFFLEAGVEFDLLVEAHKLTWRRDFPPLVPIISSGVFQGSLPLLSFTMRFSPRSKTEIRTKRSSAGGNRPLLPSLSTNWRCVL